jgi:hypothetical protein
MAPNLKNWSQLSESLAGIRLIHPKQLAPAPSAAPFVQRAETASYWDWESPACDDVDVVSTSHVEANLMRAAAAVESECGRILTNPESDSYWAMMDVDEHDDTDASADADDYWNDAVALVVQSETDDYWNMPTTTTAAAVTSAPPPPMKNNNYWNEPMHAKTSRDAYWNMSSSTASHHAEDQDEQSADAYWQWSRQAKTVSDAYWS